MAKFQFKMADGHHIGKRLYECTDLDGRHIENHSWVIIIPQQFSDFSEILSREVIFAVLDVLFAIKSCLNCIFSHLYMVQCMFLWNAKKRRMLSDQKVLSNSILLATNKFQY